MVKAALPLVKKTGSGGLGGFLEGRGISPHRGLIPDRPAHSKSLYRLNYLGLLVQYDVSYYTTNNMHMQKYIYSGSWFCTLLLRPEAAVDRRYMSRRRLVNRQLF
jgi:hypothetical protein